MFSKSPIVLFGIRETSYSKIEYLMDDIYMMASYLVMTSAKLVMVNVDEGGQSEQAPSDGRNIAF